MRLPGYSGGFLVDRAAWKSILSTTVIVGGLGFPVLVEFIKRVRPSRWTLNTRITLLATAGLLVIGPALVLALEWSNPLTLSFPLMLSTPTVQTPANSAPHRSQYHSVG